MQRLINSFEFGNITVNYVLNNYDKVILIICPKEKKCELFSEKNIEAYDNASLVQLKLSNHDSGIYSNSFRSSETLEHLKFKEQKIKEDDEAVTVITTEESEDNYGIKHFLKWYRGENGFEVYTEFFNNSGKSLKLQYLTSASLDAISPYLSNEGSKDLFFHRFKAGWSMEGLHQEDSLTALGLEQAWATSGECIKLGAIGSRSVREYHPYGAIEDKRNNVIWGVYLAHNASWQMELSRYKESVSLSIGLADSMTGDWNKWIKDGQSFVSPKAIISVTTGGIAELSNKMLSMRHRPIDAYGEEGMGIAYNDYATTWGHPTEESMLKMADFLKSGKTKYLIMDAGWFFPRGSNGDWVVNTDAFPNGMKHYTNEVRKRGMIPGIWMEFENIGKNSKLFGEKCASMKLKCEGKIIVGHCINGGLGNFFDFRNKEVIEYLDDKVIKFLKDNGFGYLKIDYNISTGIGVDGDESPGENLRQHMEEVRKFIIKIKNEIPDIIIENCSSGGCRLEPSMMDITAVSSASDTHEVYEAAVVAANLHYLAPPRQNQIWSTLKPEYSKERFSYVISQGFLGRLCWSGFVTELSDEQLKEMFEAERFYEKVSPIIKHGNSYIFRTDICSFHSPTGTQAVVRYSEDENYALVVTHSFEERKELEIVLKDNYIIESSLYPIQAQIDNKKLKIIPSFDFSGNVYLLKKI